MTAPIPPTSNVTHHIIDENSAHDGIQLDLIGDYAQRVDFGVKGANTFVIDEPPPLGINSGPSPTRVLGAALASCLGASLLFCLKKSHVDVLGLHTIASVKLKRNEQGRLRVESIDVRLEPVVSLEQRPNIARCLEVFEDYCVVTASVRPGITVNVSVHPVAPGNAQKATEAVGELPSGPSETASELPSGTSETVSELPSEPLAIPDTPATDSLQS